MKQEQSHSTEINQGGTIYEEDVQLLAKTIGAKISEGVRKMDSISDGCLYRVPEELRKLNESAFTPRLIAIGPLHRNDEHLPTLIQQFKMSYADELLCRLTERKKSELFQECIAAMKTLKERAQKCYVEDVTLDEEMMFVDGCFILELLFKYILGCDARQTLLKASGRTTDPFFDNDFISKSVRRDLLLLENQIPYFVLEELFRLTVARIVAWIPNSRYRNLSINDLIVAYFGKVIRAEKNSPSSARATTTRSGWLRDCILWVFGKERKNSEEIIDAEESEVRNSNAPSYYFILHKLHEYCLRHTELDDAKKKQPNFIPSASELDYAGVKFVPGTEKDLFNVKFTEPEGPFSWFDRARLEIPILKLVDSTETRLRNLIAFEQCCLGASKPFTSYAILMDMLVNSEKDVEVLEKAGIFHICLGSNKDVADLFNNLANEVVIGDFFFAETCDKAKEYCECFWPKNMAHVRRTYFASPWTFTAFTLGFIVFGIQIVAFVRSFL